MKTNGNLYTYIVFSIFLTYFWLTATNHIAHAAENSAHQILLSPTTHEIAIGPYLYYIEDKDNELSIREVSKRPNQQWTPHSKHIFNRGYSSSAFWLSFEVKLTPGFNPQDKFFLNFDMPFFNYIDTYVYADGVLIKSFETGLMRPISQRGYPSESFVFPLLFESGVDYRVIIKANSVSTILIPLTLYDEIGFQKDHSAKNMLMGFYLGLCIILALYNFFLFLATKDINYFLYTIHVLGLCWLQASIRGYTLFHLWGDEFHNFSYYEPTLVVWVAFGTSILFTRNFLNLKKLHPIWNKIVEFGFLICIFYLVGTFILPTDFVLASFHIFSPVIIFLVLGIAIYSLLKGNHAARFFLLGWSFFLGSAMLKSIYYLGWLPTNFFTENPIIIGSAIEGALLSLALADRINYDRKEKALAQKAAVDALEHSNKIKDDFLISISHELRTPLAGIIGALSVSKEDKNTNVMGDYNSLIEKSADRMSDTIDSILCLTEINSGELKLNPDDFDFYSQFQDLFDTISKQCEEKNISFNHDIKVPPQRRYCSDVNKIRLIFKHLLQNAVSFTDKGNINLLVEESEAVNRTMLDIHIYDTGAGIEEDKLKLIFEAFQQLSGGYARTHEGLGIGLTISKSLIDIMGGSIEVESKLNMGTHLHLQIPVTISTDAVKTSQKSPMVAAHINVLVVEDNVVNQKVLTAMLKKLHCHIEVACNGMECLKAVEKNKPDIILMDCQMPIMDGIEATRILRERYSDDALPIVAVTANALSNDRERCYEAGMNDYLIKPVKLETIKDALEKWTAASVS